MAESKINAVIVGGSGYTGLELLRLLLRHPRVQVAGVTSRTYQGQRVQQVFPSLGYTDLLFSDPAAGEIAREAQVVFTAVPHKEAMNIIARLFPDQRLKIIDLSADFRFQDPETYQTWYGPHQAPDLLKQAVYGLPEIHTAAIRQARLIGNPGCYSTSIILGLAPLLKERVIEPLGLVADSKSGVSGAGRSLHLGSLYCEVDEGFKAYKVGGKHRHARNRTGIEPIGRSVADHHLYTPPGAHVPGDTLHSLCLSTKRNDLGEPQGPLCRLLPGSPLRPFAGEGETA